MKEDEQPPCKIESKDQFCYIIRPGTENRFILSFPKYSQIGVEGWNKIFGLIRRSDWATSNGIKDDTVVTVGIYFLWYFLSLN
jgi:hypothetical protein